MLGDVVLQVARNGTNVGRVQFPRAHVINHLIAAEEAEQVVVALESLDDAKDALQILGVVRFLWCSCGDGSVGQGAIDVDDQVDPRGVEDGGAVVMVHLGNQVVNADSVEAEILHQDSVAQASGPVGERVLLGLGLETSAAAGLVAGCGKRQHGYRSDRKTKRSRRRTQPR